MKLENALNAVLSAYPAAGEVYENMHYAQSGLSRSTLDRSVASEMATSQLLAKLAAGSPTARGRRPVVDQMPVLSDRCAMMMP